MFPGLLIGKTILSRLRLGSSQHVTQLGMADGSRNRPIALMKTTKHHKHCDRNIPLQREGETAVNVIQKSNRSEKWVTAENAHEVSCDSNSALRNWNGITLLRALLLYSWVVDFHCLPSYAAIKTSNQASSSSRLFWSSHLSNKEQSEEDESHPQHVGKNQGKDD